MQNLRTDNSKGMHHRAQFLKAAKEIIAQFQLVLLQRLCLLLVPGLVVVQVRELSIETKTPMTILKQLERMRE